MEEDKPRRGRPKGSKNKRTLDADNKRAKASKINHTTFVDNDGITKAWWKKRATKCTEELTNAICRNLSIGMYVNESCIAEGLTPSTANAWKNKAEVAEMNGELDSPYISFRDAVVMAHAQAERDIMLEIRHAHTNQTNFANLAWILERTRNKRFGQRQEITSTVENIPAGLPPKAPKDYDEWLLRRQQRQELFNSTEAEVENVQQVQESSDV